MNVTLIPLDGTMRTFMWGSATIAPMTQPSEPVDQPAEPQIDQQADPTIDQPADPTMHATGNTADAIPATGAMPPSYVAPYPAPNLSEYGAYAGPYERGRPKFESMAIVAFVFSFLTGIVGLILGIIALNRIKMRGTRGRGLAISSIVISVVLMLAVGGTILYQVLHEAKRDNTGAVTVAGDIDVFALNVGDCVAELPADNVEVKTVRVVPCSQPHQVEAFFRGLLPEGAFPGTDGVTKSVEAKCSGGFLPYIGVTYEVSKLDLFYFAPIESGWSRGDRGFVCLASAGTAPTTGSVQGARK